MSSSSRQTPKKPQRRFQFIDNSDIGASGANSTQVRRHVMQEYMREKRWESRARVEGELLTISPHSQPSQAKTKPPIRKPSSKQRLKNRSSTKSHDTDGGTSIVPPDQISASPVTDSDASPTDDPTTSTSTLPRTVTSVQSPESLRLVSNCETKFPRRGFYLTPQSFAAIADIDDVSPPTPTSTITSGEFLSPSPSSASSSSSPSTHQLTGDAKHQPKPLSLLSAARTDPFNCLPMKLTKNDQELFDFYANVMPACSYGFERRNPRAHNWYLSVFIPEAMKSPVAFQNTILVHAANTQAWVRGLSETPLSIEHRARASQMLSEHFQKQPRDISDAAISSTLSAAALEDFDPRLERRQYAWMHWQAAVRKIRDRGGPAALIQHTSLRMLINWSDYIFSGYNGHGSTFFFDHKSSPQHDNGLEARAIACNELAQQCEELIVFLRCAESLALVTANMQHNATAREKQPLRHSVFELGQPLYTLLASSNEARYTKTGQLKQIISRLAALMTINVAIWEYRYSTKASETFFQELIENVKNNDLDVHISVEALLQILLGDSQHLSLIHTERPWLVGRLLKVAKRLSRESWERLNSFLLQCLTLGPNLRPLMEDWEQELRMEIMSAPLVSHVLPLMQP